MHQVTGRLTNQFRIISILTNENRAGLLVLTNKELIFVVYFKF